MKQSFRPPDSRQKSGSLLIHSDGRSISHSGLQTANSRLPITFLTRRLSWRSARSAIRECRTIRELRVSRQGAIACAGQTVTRLQLVPALRVSHR